MRTKSIKSCFKCKILETKEIKILKYRDKFYCIKCKEKEQERINEFNKLNSQYNILCCDLETETCGGCEDFNHSHPRIWLAGFRELWTQKGKEYLNFMSMFYDLMNIYKLGKNILYFHNGGKFDWNYCVGELIDNGFEYLESNEFIYKIKNKEKRKHFKIFGGEGKIFKITIYYKNREFQIRDSIFLMSGSIKAWGGKEYGSFGDNKEKYAHKTLTNVKDLPHEDWLIFNSDMVTMCRVLTSKEFYGNIPDKDKLLPLTLSSYALDLLFSFKPEDKNDKCGYWIKSNIKDKLLLEQWDYYHKGYRGGIVYEHPKVQFNQIYKGIIKHYDVTSMYPFIWQYYSLPYGVPTHRKLTMLESDKEKLKPHRINNVLPEFLRNKNEIYHAYHSITIHKAKLKDGCLPYIGILANQRVKPPKNDIDSELWYYLYKDRLRDVLTNYDVVFWDLEYDCWDIQLKLIEQLYDISYTINKTTYFETRNYGRPFVDLLEKDKAMYELAGDEQNRSIVKLKLNGCYGKHGQNRIRNEYIFELRDKNEKRNKSLRYFEVPNTDKIYLVTSKQTETTNTLDLNYVPLASFTTAMASVYITYFRNLYESSFIYADTDDMYLMNTELDNKYINNDGIFGYFKHNEAKDTFTAICIKAPKNYYGVLLHTDNKGNSQVVKSAGFTCHTEMSIEEYQKSMSFINGKKMIKKIKGRNLIVTQTGKINFRKKIIYDYKDWQK